MKHTSLTILAVCLWVFSSATCFAVVINIPVDYPTIQQGIDAAGDGDEIVISDGTYTGVENTDLTWDGTDKHLIIRSENGAETVMIDCENSARAFNFVDSGQNLSDQIDGLSIINGDGTAGGAIYMSGVSPEIRNCRFLNCSAGNALAMGGAIYCMNSDSQISGSYFEGNESFYYGGAIYGYASNLNLDSCEFVDNSCGICGGALGFYSDSSNISNCIFTSNGASDGAAVSLNESQTIITNSEFNMNIARTGGAIYLVRSSQTQIGGGPGLGNTFSNNMAGSGADLASETITTESVNATYNNFQGNAKSDYFVSPQGCFNTDNCSSGTTLVQQNLYVSPHGSDLNDGLSDTSPLQTINEALKRIDSTSTQPLKIFLAEGIYSPSLTNEIFPLPVIPGISIEGTDKSNTIIDAESSGLIFYAQRDELFQMSQATLQNPIESGSCMRIEETLGTFTDVVYKNDCENSYSALLVQSCPNITLTRCDFSDYSGELIYSLKSTLVAEDCDLCGVGTEGLYLVYSNLVFNDCAFDNGDSYMVKLAVSDALFNRCSFRNNITNDSNPFAQLFFSGGSAQFFNCVFAENTSSEHQFFMEVDDAAIVELTNCTLVNNTTAEPAETLIKSELSRFEMTNCILWNNHPLLFDNRESTILISYSDIQGGYEGIGNIDADPMFLSASDYHLSSGSPCIDTGTAFGVPNTDCEGHARPCGGTWDMGAYEYDGFSGPSTLYLRTPDPALKPGDPFMLEAVFWNNDGQDYLANPFFCLMMIGETFFFMPDFDTSSYYTVDLYQGDSRLVLLPEFTWPEGAGLGSATIYSALTNPQMTDLMWNLVQFDFTWSE